MNIGRLFTEHPATVGETYGQHMRSALSFAVPLLGASLACFVHAALPFLFTRTGSCTITRLYDRMVLSRSRVAGRSEAVTAVDRPSTAGAEARHTA